MRRLLMKNSFKVDCRRRLGFAFGKGIGTSDMYVMPESKPSISSHGDMRRLICSTKGPLPRMRLILFMNS